MQDMQDTALSALQTNEGNVLVHCSPFNCPIFQTSKQLSKLKWIINLHAGMLIGSSTDSTVVFVFP
jgi:hypothetical protein